MTNSSSLAEIHHMLPGDSDSILMVPVRYGSLGRDLCSSILPCPPPMPLSFLRSQTHVLWAESSVLGFQGLCVLGGFTRFFWQDRFSALALPQVSIFQEYSHLGKSVYIGPSSLKLYLTLNS